jgi:hypothetical protein
MTKIIRSTALLTLIAAFVLGIGACKKDAAPAAKSKTELLTQSNWKIVKEEYKTGAGAWIDNTSNLACEKDNNIVFRTTATFELNEGATKCNPADPQIFGTGTWSFLTSETQLQIVATGSPSSETRSLDQLDENTMVLSRSETIGGVTESERITLGH